MARSEVFIPEGRTGWWGGPDTRLRCKADDKVVFMDKEAAERAAQKACDRGTPMKYYRGRCGHLHVARIKGGK